MFGGLPHVVIGLDVGTTSVKAVRLEHARAGAKLLAAALDDIKPDGAGLEARDAARLHALKSSLSKVGPTTDAVVVTAVSGPGVSIKHVTFPSMPMSELAESIRWEARKHVPFGESEFVLDFQILNGEAKKSDEEDVMRVLLTAVERRLVDEHVAFLGGAGVEPDTVDLVPLALMNEADEEGLIDDRTVAVADLGHAGVNLSIYRRGGLLFARTVPIVTAGARGGEAMQWLDTAVKEVRRSLAFYQNEFGKQAIDKMYLSGGRSLADAVPPSFHHATGVETSLLDPFARAGFMTPEVEPLRPQGARFALAMGLARRRT